MMNDEQDELQPGGEQQEDRVDHGQRPRRSASRCRVPGVARRRSRRVERPASARRPPRTGTGSATGALRQVQREVERVVGEQRRDQHELDQRCVVISSAATGTSFCVLPREERPACRSSWRRSNSTSARHQRPGQVGAEHRDDQADADEDRAPRGRPRPRARRHRRLAQPAMLGARQDRRKDSDRHRARTAPARRGSRGRSRVPTSSRFFAKRE